MASKGENEDSYSRYYLQAVTDRIYPPVFGVELYFVGDEENRVLVVEIPESRDIPHLIESADSKHRRYFPVPVRIGAATRFQTNRKSRKCTATEYLTQTILDANSKNSLMRQQVKGTKLACGVSELVSRDIARFVLLQITMRFGRLFTLHMRGGGSTTMLMRHLLFRRQRIRLVGDCVSGSFPDCFGTPFQSNHTLGSIFRCVKWGFVRSRISAKTSTG